MDKGASDKLWKRKTCCGVERAATNTEALARFLIFGLGISLVVLSVLFYETLKDNFLTSLRWIDNLGLFYGSLVLCIANIVGAILFLRFLYGTLYGTLLVTVASNVAALVGFLTARYLARQLVESKLGTKGSKFRVIDNAISKDGFRIVFLIRSSPLHPYGVCNYLFGLTSITLWDHAVASLIAMTPTTICEVYFGTAIHNVADILSGNLEGSPLSRAFFWGGLLLTAGITAYISWWVKVRLKAELDKYEESPGNSPLAGPVCTGHGRERDVERMALLSGGLSSAISPSSSPDDTLTLSVSGIGIGGSSTGIRPSPTRPILPPHALAASSSFSSSSSSSLFGAASSAVVSLASFTSEGSGSSGSSLGLDTRYTGMMGYMMSHHHDQEEEDVLGGGIGAERMSLLGHSEEMSPLSPVPPAPVAFSSRHKHF